MHLTHHIGTTRFNDEQADAMRTLRDDGRISNKSAFSKTTREERQLTFLQSLKQRYGL